MSSGRHVGNPGRRSWGRRLAASVAVLASGAMLAARLVGANTSPPSHPTAGALPDSLTDQEFSALIADVSEPDGFFDSDNLLSNELSYQRVIPALRTLVPPGGVYLGVGPEQNFTYIAALQPKMAIIFDIRRGNMLLHLLYKSLFELSPDRADFLARMYARPRPPGLDTLSSVAALFAAFAGVRPDTAIHRQNLAAALDQLQRHGLALGTDDLAGIRFVYDAFYQAGPALDYNYLSRSANGGGQRPTYANLMEADDGQGVQRSYLASEAHFRVIRRMHARNMIVPVVGDFAGPKAIVAVGTYLRAHDATATTFYTSNVEQYLFQQPQSSSRYYRNVAALPLDSTSTFIRAVFASARVIPGLAGNASVTLLCPMQGLIDAFNSGRLRGYQDVVAMSY